MSKSRDIADSAATINFIDTVSSNVQTQLNTATAAIATNTSAIATNTSAISNISVTNGSLTKTFTNGESASVSLTSNVLVPVVSVTKEVPQTGATNNTWDVNSTSQNYTRLNSAPATTLSFSGSPNLADTAYLTNAAIYRDTVDIFMSPDGTQFYQFNDWNNECFQFTLTTAGDVSTKPTSYTEKFYTNVSGVGNAIRGGFWKSDGTVLYVFSSSDIAQFTTSSAYSAGSVNSTNTGTRSLTSPHFVRISSDGTKIFYMQISGAVLRQRNMSTAWDVSTASASDDATFSLTSQMSTSATLGGLHVSADGLTLYTAELSSKTIYQWSFGTANDISTLTFVSKITGNSSANSLRGLAFSPASKSFIHSDNETTPKVYGYSLAQAIALGSGSFASADVGKTIEANSGAFVLTAASGSYVQTTAPTSYAQVAPGSWEMYGVVYNTVDGDLELSSGAGSTLTLDLLGDGSCIAAYTFDNTPNDLSTNYNGTWVGTADYVAGKYGNAASFDGNNKYITTGLTLPTANFSVSVWFDLGTQIRPWARLVDTWVNTSSSGFLIARDNQTNDLWIELGNSSARHHTVISNFFTTYASGWHNITVVHALPVASVYIDGSLVTTFTPATTVTNSNSLWFASSNIFPTSEEYVGLLDQARIFNKALSASEAATVYNETSTIFPTGYHPVHTTASTDTTYWTDINSMTADQAAGDGEVYYAISTDDRTTWTVIDNTDGERDIVRNNAGTWQYNSNATYASETWVNGATNTELATLAEAMEGAAAGYNLSIANYNSVNLDISAQITNNWGAWVFGDNGNKLYVKQDTGNLYQYSLSSAYDISTASFDKSHSLGNESFTTGIAFNNDGTKLYNVGRSSNPNVVYEHDLSTPWDIASETYNSVSLSLTSPGTVSWGALFNPDGTIMYISDFISNSIYQYSLSSAFDLSTASYASKSLSAAAQGTNIRGMAFNGGGTKFFVTAKSNGVIYQYGLTVAYDISSASYDSVSYDASVLYAGNTNAVLFNANGSKMFVAKNQFLFELDVATFINQMDKTQLDAVTDPNHIALGNDFDLSIILNMTSGTTVPSSNGVAINYDANILNKGAVLGTDYDFDAPAQNSVRITALAGNNLKVRVV